MAENKAPEIENEADLGEKWDKFKNRGYWGYREGEEGTADGEDEGFYGGCGAGGG
jgi:hypothetical protein